MCAALMAVSLVGGFLGALTGLGGGVVLVPALTLFFGVDIRYAMGASLVSVIATSSGAAAAYVREGFSNIRVAMFLEVATTLGALAGASLTTVLPTRFIAVVFGLVLLYSAWISSTMNHEEELDSSGSPAEDPLSKKLRLSGSFPDPHVGTVAYEAKNVALGFSAMGAAGVLSGLLGIGSGAVKVIAMDHLMRLPFKVSTTTSNFMIGVTAAASAGVYLHRGYVSPGLAMPVTLGVLAGSVLGARKLIGAKTRVLRVVFALTIAALGIEMLRSGIVGRI